MSRKSHDPPGPWISPRHEPSNHALTRRESGKSPVSARNPRAPRRASSLATRSAVVSLGSVNTSTVLAAGSGSRFMASTNALSLIRVVVDLRVYAVAVAVRLIGGHLVGAHPDHAVHGAHPDHVARDGKGPQGETERRRGGVRDGLGRRPDDPVASSEREPLVRVDQYSSG